MHTINYNIEGEFLGTAVISHEFAPHSIAYCCPSCGRIWANVYLSSNSKCYWVFEPAPCKDCVVEGGREYGRIPGCILLEKLNYKQNLSIMWWGRAIEHLPAAVLQREFELTLNYYEGIYNDNKEEAS